MTKNICPVYIGFNRPMRPALHAFILSISTELEKRGMITLYPKSSARLIDAKPTDGFWTVHDLKPCRCKSALFVFDQNGAELDTAAQLGFALAAGLLVSCILVRRSVCGTPVKELLTFPT